jgi:hypothetical protein
MSDTITHGILIADSKENDVKYALSVAKDFIEIDFVKPVELNDGIETILITNLKLSLPK